MVDVPFLLKVLSMSHQLLPSLSLLQQGEAM